MRLVTWPNSILETKLPPIEVVTNEHWEIAQEMQRIMRLYEGVGLAANQVDYPFRIFITEGRVFINPEIIMTSGIRFGTEGCLSMPGLRQPKTRAASLKLRFTTIGGDVVTERFTGFQARIIQHEVDHLNGILCLQPQVTKNA